MEMARSLASPSAAPAMAETSDLESRVRALLDRGRNRAPLTRRAALTVAALTCALVLPMATLTTHAQANHGALAGLVKDPSGARIPGAAITAKNLDGTNVESTVADAAGEYGFRSIPAGKYEIEARVRGFAMLKMQAVVTAGVAARADLMMSVGGVTEVVTVRSTRTTPKPAQVPARAAERIPIGGNVEMAKLLKQPRAVYPQELKDQGVTGTVRIKAIISKNGDLLNPRVVNTVDPRLAQAALDAVKTWLYEPTRLNGQPVEVLTDIDIVFELDQ
jgi:TonB family protein